MSRFRAPNQGYLVLRFLSNLSKESGFGKNQNPQCECLMAFPASCSGYGNIEHLNFRELNAPTPNALPCADRYDILYLLQDLVNGASGCETTAVSGEIDGYIG